MDIRTREVEDIFYKYGRIRDIDVKFPSRPPAFAFVDFEDVRDAEDAIRGRDGYEYDGARLRVEFANGGRRESGREASSRGSTRYPRNIRGTGDFTVEVSNLPPRVSWQDLKDFMRKAGDVVFTEVDGRGGGVVEYSNKRDMKYAVEKLDDTEYRGRSENSYVRVRMVGSRGRSNSRSKSPSRSRSRSNMRRSGKKRSRSRSEDKDGGGEKKTKRSQTPEKEAVKEDEAEKDDENGKEAEITESTCAIDKEEETESTEVEVERKDDESTKDDGPTKDDESMKDGMLMKDDESKKEDELTAETAADKDE
ncbi:unnamed protein product [Peronospora belbahrii]|uniref:RRM domain-containing protein n=1 Tax=Peronospora belbahrii TaxID=622444 RepID=A0ABN8CNA9_9STRA|nr:unnamed protein product [Peronospora belbahrii]